MNMLVQTSRSQNRRMNPNHKHMPKHVRRSSEHLKPNILKPSTSKLKLIFKKNLHYSILTLNQSKDMKN